MDPPPHLDTRAPNELAQAGLGAVLAENAQYQDALQKLLRALHARRDQITRQRRALNGMTLVSIAAKLDPAAFAGPAAGAEATTAATIDANGDLFAFPPELWKEPGTSNTDAQRPFSLFSDQLGPELEVHPAVSAIRAQLIERNSGVTTAPWNQQEIKRLQRAIVNYSSFLLLRENRASLTELADWSEHQILANVADDRIDWEHISAAYFASSRSAAECRVQWLAVSHPRYSTAKPSAAEIATIKRLAGACTDWLQVQAGMPAPRSLAWVYATHQESRRKAGDYKGTRKNWTKDEDNLLTQAVYLHGHPSPRWEAVAQVVGTRDFKQCLQRWKALDPAMRRGRFTAAEDEALDHAHEQFGDRWSEVAAVVVGRSDMQCRERYVNQQAEERQQAPWSQAHDEALANLVRQFGPQWSVIAASLPPPARSDRRVAARWAKVAHNYPDVARRAGTAMAAPGVQSPVVAIPPPSPRPIVSVPATGSPFPLPLFVSSLPALPPAILRDVACLAPSRASLMAIHRLCTATAIAVPGSTTEFIHRPAASGAAVTPGDARASGIPSDLLQQLGSILLPSALAARIPIRPHGWAGPEEDRRRRQAIVGAHASITEELQSAAASSPTQDSSRKYIQLKRQ